MLRMMVGVVDLEEELQDDHRKARDGILELLGAIEARDVRRAREIAGIIDLVSGPHWRWEEEALYPALRKFTDELVEGLLREHDDFTEALRGLIGLLNQRKILAPEEWERARVLTRPLLYHLATCDGLLLWTELLDDGDKATIKQAIFVARRQGLPLLEWNDKLRRRRGPHPPSPSPSEMWREWPAGRA